MKRNTIILTAAVIAASCGCSENNTGSDEFAWADGAPKYSIGVTNDPDIRFDVCYTNNETGAMVLIDTQDSLPALSHYLLQESECAFTSIHKTNGTVREIYALPTVVYLGNYKGNFVDVKIITPDMVEERNGMCYMSPMMEEAVLASEAAPVGTFADPAEQIATTKIKGLVRGLSETRGAFLYSIPEAALAELNWLWEATSAANRYLSNLSTDKEVKFYEIQENYKNFKQYMEEEDIVHYNVEKGTLDAFDDWKGYSERIDEILSEGIEQAQDNLGILPPGVQRCVSDGMSHHYQSDENDRYEKEFDMGHRGGTFTFEYYTCTYPDEIIVYDGTLDEAKNGRAKVIFHYNDASVDRFTTTLQFSTRRISVIVNGGSVWDYTVNCPAAN